MSVDTPTRDHRRPASCGRGPGLQAPAAARPTAHALRPGDGPPGRDRDRSSCSTRGHDAESRHVPGRGRHRADGDRDRPVDRHRREHRSDRLPGGADALAARSRCSSPTSPRPWPKRGARPRPTACARRGQDTPAFRLDASARTTARSSRRRSCAPATSCWSRPGR